VDWQAQEIILASASPIRRRLLEAAGLEIKVVAATINEQTVRQTFTAGANLGYGELARRLAMDKAREVSKTFPAAWVIGADQVLFSGDRLFVKPATIAAARSDLRALRGRWHMLASAATVAIDGEIVWDDVDTARLKMRKFSDGFLESYITRSGPDILTSVGGYKLEDQGIQLFERFEGDYFTILGLPLLPVLTFLRSGGCLAR
jgi:septum formation protein